MADSNGTSDVQIPCYVGQYRTQSGQIKPEVCLIDSDKQLTKAEQRVCDFFKCTVNWDQNEENVNNCEKSSTNCKKCFATRNTTFCFEVHLKERHPSLQFFCVYCYNVLSNGSNLKKYPYNYLIKHMVKRHRLRRFQCNLCLYRALTEEHVFLHQKMVHISEYLSSLSDQLIPNSSNSLNNVCKVFVCPKLTPEKRDIYYYWNKYKEKRLNCKGKNETFFQCLYCSFMDEIDSKVLEHCVVKHADYPLLYYIPDPQVSSSTAVQLVPHFDCYETQPTIRPKLEPQDNCVSSTQKSPENVIIDNESNDTNDSLNRKPKDKPNKRQRIKSVSSDESEAQENNLINRMTICLTNNSNLQKDFICLFCEQTFVNSDDAINHLRSHFDEESLNDTNVTNWIRLFVLKQWNLCSFEASKPTNSTKISYNCPLCVKMAKFHNRVPKNYETENEAKKHLWQHCFWTSVKCRLCQTSIYNSDSLIAKHFIDNRSAHFSVLKVKKFKFLENSEPNNVKFTEEQRTELEKRYIDIKRNSIIDSFIKQLLEIITTDFEEKLKQIIYNKVLRVNVHRLDNNMFNVYINHYLDYEEIISKKKEKESTRKSNKTDKKEKKKSLKNNLNKREVNSGEKNINNVNKDSDLSIDRQLEVISSVISDIQNDPQTSSNTEVIRQRISSTESIGQESKQNSDSESSSDEKLNRISCFHCNDKFKNKKEFREHSKKAHPNRAERMYAKPRKK